MSSKRPHASEGHLRLPAQPAGAGRKSADRARTLPVAGDELAAHGIVPGDQVVVVQRALVEHGDIVVRRGEDGVPTLWKAYPERGVVRLSNGTGRLDVPGDTLFEGVVVAVVRQFRN